MELKKVNKSKPQLMNMKLKKHWGDRMKGKKTEIFTDAGVKSLLIGLEDK
jgi:hypothetical protein